MQHFCLIKHTLLALARSPPDLPPQRTRPPPCSPRSTLWSSRSCRPWPPRRSRGWRWRMSLSPCDLWRHNMSPRNAMAGWKQRAKKPLPHVTQRNVASMLLLSSVSLLVKTATAENEGASWYSPVGHSEETSPLKRKQCCNTEPYLWLAGCFWPSLGLQELCN